VAERFIWVSFYQSVSGEVLRYSGREHFEDLAVCNFPSSLAPNSYPALDSKQIRNVV